MINYRSIAVRLIVRWVWVERIYSLIMKKHNKRKLNDINAFNDRRTPMQHESYACYWVAFIIKGLEIQLKPDRSAAFAPIPSNAVKGYFFRSRNGLINLFLSRLKVTFFSH